MNLPYVSVGIPVYNGDKFLKKALISITFQSYKNLEIIISNNCSTDNSLQIMEKFKNLDNRIVIYNQTKKLSLMDNFRFVLEKSKSNYFMWAACDDFRSRHFIKKNLEFLEKNTDFVASISPTRFHKHAYNSNKIGDYTVDDVSAYKRINKALKLNANSRFYSLYRKSDLRLFKHNNHRYLGDDFAVVIHMLQKGKFKNIGKERLILGKFGLSNDTNLFNSYQKNIIDFLLPFNNLLKEALFLTNSISIKLLIFLKITKFNYDANILRLKRLIIKIIR